jgi:hypothetical protein
MSAFAIGEPDALVVGAFDIVLRQVLLDLRARAMHQHQPDAETGKQVEVMGQLDELAVRDYFAAERDHESASAERVDVRRDGTEPGDEFGRGGDGHLYLPVGICG